MRSAVLYQTGQPLVLEEGVEIPALRPGQVLVKIAYAGVCRSQVMEARGKRGPDPFLPHLLGHEGSGIVLDVGSGVQKVGIGEAVILGWIKGEGTDAGPSVYQKQGRRFNAGPVTTFSDYAVVSENRCVPVPEGIPLDVAVLFGCALPTGAGILIHEVRPAAGSTIAFFGLGGIGLCALMAAGLFECRTVIAVDVEEEKLRMARSFGATHCIDAQRENPVQRILQITGGSGVDYSVEAAGLSTTIEQAFESVRSNGGLCVFASHPQHGDRIRLDPHQLISGKRIRGSWGGACRPDRDIPELARLYRDGKLPLERILTHRYPLEGINQALDDLENRRIGRALIEIDTAL